MLPVIQVETPQHPEAGKKWKMKLNKRWLPVVKVILIIIGVMIVVTAAEIKRPGSNENSVKELFITTTRSMEILEQWRRHPERH